MRYPDWESLEADLGRALGALERGFVILRAGDFQAQFLLVPGGVIGELVGSTQVGGPFQITEAAHAAIGELGWKSPGDAAAPGYGPIYSVGLTSGSGAQFADITVRALALLGAEAGADWEILADS